VIALGTSGAYAVDKVTSDDIRDGSIRSADLRDRKGVRGRDVIGNSIGGQEINESTLDARQLLNIAGSDAPSCNPTGVDFTPCVHTTVDLSRPSNLFLLVTGNQFTGGQDEDGSQGSCKLQVDGVDRGPPFSPGESGSSSHKLFSTNGFARTLVVPDGLTAGPHEVSMACSETSPDYWIGTPTIAVLAVSAG
jgi:hypothetical protein